MQILLLINYEILNRQKKYVKRIISNQIDRKFLNLKKIDYTFVIRLHYFVHRISDNLLFIPF